MIQCFESHSAVMAPSPITAICFLSFSPFSREATAIPKLAEMGKRMAIKKVSNSLSDLLGNWFLWKRWYEKYPGDRSGSYVHMPDVQHPRPVDRGVCWKHNAGAVKFDYPSEAPKCPRWRNDVMIKSEIFTHLRKFIFLHFKIARIIDLFRDNPLYFHHFQWWYKYKEMGQRKWGRWQAPAELWKEWSYAMVLELNSKSGLNRFWYRLIFVFWKRNPEG